MFACGGDRFGVVFSNKLIKCIKRKEKLKRSPVERKRKGDTMKKKCVKDLVKDRFTPNHLKVIKGSEPKKKKMDYRDK